MRYKVAPKVAWATLGGAFLPALGILLTQLAGGTIAGLPGWVPPVAALILGAVGAFIPGYTAPHQNRGNAKNLAEPGQL